MYAIIALGGKQQLVKEGDVLEVEKQPLEDGAKLTISEVLLVADGDTVHIGQPTVQGASVVVEVLKQVKAAKVVAYKYRRRKASHTKRGHRQQLTRIQVKKIKSS